MITAKESIYKAVEKLGEVIVRQETSYECLHENSRLTINKLKKETAEAIDEADRVEKTNANLKNELVNLMSFLRDIGFCPDTIDKIAQGHSQMALWEKNKIKEFIKNGNQKNE